MGLMDYLKPAQTVDPKDQTKKPSLADDLIKKQQAIKDVNAKVNPPAPPKK